MKHCRKSACFVLVLLSVTLLSSLPEVKAYTDQDWIDPVRWSRTIRVYTFTTDLHDQASRIHRLNITSLAVQRFNALSNRGVCLRLDMESNHSEANVIIQYQDWTILNMVLGIVGRNVAGQTVHSAPPRKIDEAVITLPSNFKYDSNGDGNADKELDDYVRGNVALHELIHAAGLNEHARDSTDLFYPDLRLEIVNGTAQILNTSLSEETIARLRLKWSCPEIHPLDSGLVEGYIHSPEALIYAAGSGFQPQTTYRLYSQEALGMGEGDNFISKSLNVTADVDGNLPPAILRRISSPGTYAIAVDYNNDGVYQKGLDIIAPFYVRKPADRLELKPSVAWKTVTPGGIQEFEILVSAEEGLGVLRAESSEIYPSSSAAPLSMLLKPTEISQVNESTAIDLQIIVSTEANFGPHLISLTLGNQYNSDTTAVVVKVQKTGIPPRTSLQATATLLVIITLAAVATVLNRRRRVS